MIPYIGLVVWLTLMQLYSVCLSIPGMLSINRIMLVTGKPIDQKETELYNRHLSNLKLAGWTILGLFVSTPVMFFAIEVMRIIDGR